MKSDGDLVALVKRGDLEAYGELVKRYQSFVFGVAFHLLGNVEDARDAAQDVFIRAFTRLAQLREPGRMGPWLRQIAVNESRAKLGKRQHWEPLLETAAGADQMRLAEDRLLLAAALRAIDEPSRLTVILFYLHAYSLKEIGSHLDEPETTIKSRLRNARAKLRREMEDILERNLSQGSLPEDFSERVVRMIEAARTGDTATIRALLDDDPSLLDARETPGLHTPLHIAAASGDAPLVELLLSYGADPNAIDESDNASPLHYAAERGWFDCVKLLVEAGSDVNNGNTVHQATPLGWAMIFEPSQPEVAEYLIAHGAKVDIFSAIALGRSDVVRELVKEDPAVLRKRMSDCERHRSVLEFAAGKKQREIGLLMVELGAEVRLADAAALGLTDRLESLLVEDIDQLNGAVKAAVEGGQVEAARMILKHGANPDYAPQGTSLIFDAIRDNNASMVEMLLSQGADLEFKDSQWNSTALGWQVFFGNPETTRLALDVGANVDPYLVELARSGERGELRRHSSGTPEGYRRVLQLLSERG